MIHFYVKKDENSGMLPYSQISIESQAALFSNPVPLLSQLRAQDRINLYFGLMQTKEPRRSKAKGETQAAWEAWMDINWLCQEVNAYDIDGVSEQDLKKSEQYIDVVAKVLGLTPQDITALKSGHGFHFYDYRRIPITDWRYFRKNKVFYLGVLDLLNQELKAAGLSGKFDPGVFDHHRVMRVPGTVNQKPGKPAVNCDLIQVSFKPTTYTLKSLLGLPEVAESEQLSEGQTKAALRNYDTETILKDCQFLKRTREEASDIHEPEGYAALSILGRMNRQLAKEYFSGWTASISMTSQDPDTKIDQALTASGPRLCTSIEKLNAKTAEKCRSCKWYQKLSTPLSIRGEEFIQSEATGFRKPAYDKDGNPRPGPGRVDHGDLLKAFVKEHHYFYDPTNRDIYLYNGKYYESITEDHVRAFSEKKVEPDPSQVERNEFLAKVKANHIKGFAEVENFFYSSVSGKINLQNGVVDIRTGILAPHSPHLGFRSILPYAYDPTARAPRFEQFLNEITLDRVELKRTLVEFMAYCIWPGYEDHVCLWLIGSGRNGKSTYLEVIQGLVGENNCKNFAVQQFVDDKNVIAELANQMVNICEEGDMDRLPKAFLGKLKTLTGGGVIDAPRKWKGTLKFRNICKLIKACNDEPKFDGVQDALKARMLMIPFDLQLYDTFTGVYKTDANLKKVLLTELPGILNLAIETLREMLKAPQFRVFRGGDVVKELVQETMNASDTVEKWLQERIILTPGSTTPVAPEDLFDDYCAFHNDADYLVKNSDTLMKRFRSKLGPRLICKRTASERFYYGVAFKGPRLMRKTRSGHPY